MIEKNIHQIWFQGEEHMKQNYHHLWEYCEGVKKVFSSYAYTLWDETNIKQLIESKAPELLEVYNGAPSLSAKSDIARFVILKEYGGHYFDTDIEVVKNFDWMLSGDDVELIVIHTHYTRLAKLITGFDFNTCFISGSKNHPLWTRLINHLIEQGPYQFQKHISKYNYALNITGPGLLSHILNSERKWLASPSTRIISSEMLEVLNITNTHLANATAEDVLQAYPAMVGMHRGEGSWIAGSKQMKSAGQIYGYCSDSLEIIGLVLIALTLLFFILFIVYAVRASRLNRRIVVLESTNLEADDT